MVGGSTAAAAGQDTTVVVVPSTMVAKMGLMPEGLGAAAEADDKAGAPVGELAATLMPVAGVRQPRGLWITAASPSAMFLNHVWA